MRILHLILALLFVPVLLFSNGDGQSQEVLPFFLQPLGTVIIDAGHGGHDPGATAEYEGEQVLEKDLTLQLSEVVGREIERLLPEVKVIYTRTDDRFVSLWRRSHIANSAEHRPGYSKLFISLHINSTKSSLPDGFEVWKLNRETEHNFFLTYLAEEGLLQMNKTLNEMLNEELQTASSLASDSLHKRLCEALDDLTRDRGIKEGNFYVLRQIIMPSLLVEAGFMSNPEELSRLQDSEYQTRIGSAVAEGIADYAKQLTASQEGPSAEDDTD